MTTSQEIREKLLSVREPEFQRFSCKSVPNISPETIIGVRLPILRRLAKDYIRRGDIGDFLASLPHAYLEEDLLHAIIIGKETDYERCVRQYSDFLPFITNWEVCDLPIPAVFRKHPAELKDTVLRWVASEHTYTRRFGIKALMDIYLDENYSAEYPEIVAATRSDEYYVNMMRAWYFATALAKRYDDILPFIEQCRMDDWTHNKSIQKACESCRVSAEHKTVLRSMRIQRKK